jgi:hypothetical protein
MFIVPFCYFFIENVIKLLHCKTSSERLEKQWLFG